MTDPWRTLPIWIGKTPNTPIPATVQERVCRRFDDICQGLCHQKLGGKLTAIMDHIIPLRDWTGAGHGNREDNLQPMCVPCHAVKTGLEKTARARVERIRKRRLGIKKKSAWAERYAWAKRIKEGRR